MRALGYDAAPGSAAAAAELAQRMVVMRCLSGACENGQLLVDVFVNYDCDLEGANLFERAVLGLVRIAQGKQSHEGPAVPSPEEQALRLAVRSRPGTITSLGGGGQEGCLDSRNTDFTCTLPVVSE